MVRHTRQQSGVSPPRLPKQFEPLHLEVANVRDSDRYADGMIENCSLKGLAAYQLELKRISLRHVTLQDTRLEKLELTDILFDHCDAANSRWHESVIHRTQMIETRLTGLDVSGSFFQHILFKDCILDLSNFRFASFKNSAFEGCTIRDGDFAGADLRGVRFARCDLGRVQFSGAKLDGADLRGSDIDGIGITPEDVWGMIVDSSQMVALSWNLARGFGIVVDDEQDE